VQAKARSHLGQDVTVFERIFDGLQTISKGDIIRLSTKPAILGRVRSGRCWIRYPCYGSMLTAPDKEQHATHRAANAILLHSNVLVY